MIQLYNKKNDCCGCEACINVCPKQAILMQEDEYGFTYPIINYSLCIECSLCKRVCAYQIKDYKNIPLNVYVASSKNDKQMFQSASGGIFAAAATQIIRYGGVVFGAMTKYTQTGIFVEHIGIQKLDDIGLLQGSKYIQSQIGNTYKEAKQYLKDNRRVLFSGTPCQIAGLRSYLGQDYENLITLDIICHGVPNAKIFNDYLFTNYKQLVGKITEFKFRDKKKGGGMWGKINYVNNIDRIKEISFSGKVSSYFTFFSEGDICRESCYSCKYACENRVGDITIGDYWGIENEHPDLLKRNLYNEENGISCIIINTRIGQNFVYEIEDMLNINQSSYEKVAHKNGQLKYPNKVGTYKNEIMELYKRDGYEKVEKFFRDRYRKQIAIYKIYTILPMNLRKNIRKIKRKLCDRR